MEYLIIWLLFGIACAMIANSKGRSVVLWLFIGILSGIIGLIIIACMPKVESQSSGTEKANA